MINSEFIDSHGQILHGRWMRAAASGEIVGSCRKFKCNGHLVAERPEEVGRTTWYEARCIKEDRHRVASPGGRTLSDDPTIMAMRRARWGSREAA